MLLPEGGRRERRRGAEHRYASITFGTTYAMSLTYRRVGINESSSPSEAISRPQTWGRRPVPGPQGPEHWLLAGSRHLNTAHENALAPIRTPARSNTINSRKASHQRQPEGGGLMAIALWMESVAKTR